MFQFHTTSRERLNYYHNLRQGSTLHSIDSLPASPDEHCPSTSVFSEFIQDCVRVCVPPPHVTPHSLHSSFRYSHVAIGRLEETRDYFRSAIWRWNYLLMEQWFCNEYVNNVIEITYDTTRANVALPWFTLGDAWALSLYFSVFWIHTRLCTSLCTTTTRNATFTPFIQVFPCTCS